MIGDAIVRTLDLNVIGTYAGDVAGGLGRDLSKSEGIARRFAGVASTVSLAAGAGIIGFSVTAAKAAATVQTASDQFEATHQVSKRNMVEFRRFVDSETTKIATDQATIYQALSMVPQGLANAWGPKGTSAIVDGAGKLAKLFNSDMGTGISTVTRLVNEFHLGLKKLPQLLDLVGYTTSHTGNSLDIFSGSLSKFLTIGAQSGASIKDLLGNAIALNNLGLGGRGFFTIASVMGKLGAIGTTESGLKYANKEGINLQTTDLQTVLKNAVAAYLANPKMGTTLGLSSSNIKLIEALVNAKHPDMANSQNYMGPAWLKFSKGDAMRWENLQMAVKKLTVTFGEDMLPIFRKGLPVLQKWLGHMQEFVKFATPQKIFEVGGGLVAGGLALKLLGPFFSAGKGVAGLIGQIFHRGAGAGSIESALGHSFGAGVMNVSANIVNVNGGVGSTPKVPVIPTVPAIPSAPPPPSLAAGNPEAFLGGGAIALGALLALGGIPKSTPVLGGTPLGGHVPNLADSGFFKWTGLLTPSERGQRSNLLAYRNLIPLGQRGGLLGTLANIGQLQLSMRDAARGIKTAESAPGTSGITSGPFAGFSSKAILEHNLHESKLQLHQYVVQFRTELQNEIGDKAFWRGLLQLPPGALLDALRSGRSAGDEIGHGLASGAEAIIKNSNLWGLNVGKHLASGLKSAEKDVSAGADTALKSIVDRLGFHSPNALGDDPSAWGSSVAKSLSDGLSSGASISLIDTASKAALLGINIDDWKAQGDLAGKTAAQAAAHAFAGQVGKLQSKFTIHVTVDGSSSGAISTNGVPGGGSNRIFNGSNFGIGNVGWSAGPLALAGVPGAGGHQDFHVNAGTRFQLPNGKWKFVSQSNTPGWGDEEVWQAPNGGLMDFMHMMSMARFKPGQWYKGGTFLGLSGGIPGGSGDQSDITSQYSTGAHLHFGFQMAALLYEMSKGGAIDPFSGGWAYPSGLGIGGGRRIGHRYGPQGTIVPLEQIGGIRHRHGAGGGMPIGMGGGMGGEPDVKAALDRNTAAIDRLVSLLERMERPGRFSQDLTDGVFGSMSG